jgi:hypothetical protein
MTRESEPGSASHTTVRSDHVAGVFFVLLGILVFVLGRELPFGTLSSPGAGMMPKLMASLMIAFAMMIFAMARSSPPATTINWSDRSHAVLVVLITALAILAYQRVGFLITMSLLVFTLLIVVERRNALAAAVYSISLTLFAYWLFGKALKAPLERGFLWF